MSQRGYPPPQRDRSPPRQFDRRSSNTYTPLATSSSYRPSNDSSQPSVDRLPPRGPRADTFRAGFVSAPRGRGAPFTPRGGDSWDRDRDRDRDARNPPSTFRRDDDRPEWSRREDRAPNFSRERQHPTRDRSASPTRPRRDSKENIGTTFSRTQESGSSYFGSNARGGTERGRGRGGWDRSRGRSSFIGERDRDLFPNRSRSREGWRDRDFDRPRNFGPESDRTDRFERREYDRSGDRDPRARDHDIWQRERDQSPGRSSTGNRAPSPGALSSVSQDRKPDYEIVRKPLTSSVLQGRDARRETDSDYFGPRNDGPRREASFPQTSASQNVPQSSSLGLDYGPPPSAPVPTPSASVPEKSSQTLKSTKPDPSPPTTAGFQPPSGPRADRSSNQTLTAQTPQTPTSSVDGRPKIESTVRQRPPFSEQITGASETPKFTPEPVGDRLTSTAQSDRPLPPNVPSGPRLSSGTPYKPKTSPIAQQIGLPPVQLKSLGLEQRSIPNAPTGPRSASILPPSGPRASLPSGPAGVQGGLSSSSWRRPTVEYRPAKPSIMGNMNRSHMSDRQPAPGMHPTSKQSPKSLMAQLVDVDRTGKLSKFETMQTTSPQADVRKELILPADIEMSAPASDDEDADDEPESELDESYFMDSEKTHAKEMERLKAKKPPQLLEDPAVVRMLIRIQLLGMIVDGSVPDSIQPVKEEKDIVMSDRPTEGLPSPQETPEDSHSPSIEHPKPRGRPLKEPPVNPIPTPPIDELPFLQQSYSGTVIFNEPLEDEVEEEKVTTLLRTQFEQEAWEEKDDLFELSEFYRAKFPEWKYEIDKYERVKRDLEATPDPGSPGAQSAASIPPSAERVTGRAARNATEFDIEKALLLSQQSAREDEERREREAASNAKPNYETEAVVPDMLKPAERALTWRFQDTNSFIPTELAVPLMQYIPPEDDFNNEEQSKFIMAFCQTPKKWGLIADQIPGRSYQDCIAHYYLTKNEVRYKEIWRRSQPKRKRGRAANKPRSTALLSDMALNEDPDSTPVPVTDSGRPRRAAAPTFGDVMDVESGGMPAAKRLAVTPKDGMENPVPKATKGRKAGTATKVRRTKAQMLADQANLDGSPVKGSGRIRTILRADNPHGKADAIVSAVLPEPHQIVNAQLSVPATSGRPKSPPPPVVTSYWSVPEQQKFRQLVAYYGRDYAKIAEFMKTKSQAMIKNHYTREISKGDTDLEKVAQIADEKISRGESTGRLPSPIAPPKRKYDPGPPMVQARPVTANTDATAEAERSMIPGKISHVEDFPPNTIHRDANGSVVAKPSPRNEPLQHSPSVLPVQTKMEDFGRDRPILAQKGPPRGHFIEESFHPHNQQRQQHLGGDPIPVHHPPQLVELRGADNPLGQTRDQLMHNQPSMQYRALESERPMSASRQGHSRHTSLAGVATAFQEQQAAEALAAAQTDRRRIPLVTAAQSPRPHTLLANLPPRTEPFPGFAPQIPHHHHHHHQQQQQQQPPPPPQPQQQPQLLAIKQEPPKPVPAKRSNVFGLLNNPDDEPPQRNVKRTSTDSSHRPTIQTPPPQPSSSQAQQSYHSRAQDEPANRSGAYGGISQHQGHGSINELRNAHSGSPATSHRVDWLERFDPRQSTIDRASNQSPFHPVAQSTTSSNTKPLLQSRTEGLRGLDPNPPRLTNLNRSQIPSPHQQVSTPVSQFRSASAAPQQQHSRMSSLGYAENSQNGQDPRGLQQTQQLPQSSQPQHLQPVSGHSSSASGTPISSMHHRGQQSIDYGPRRLTIQEYKARENLEPSQVHEAQRQGLDHREMYRSEPLNHQVPPPPSRAPQLNHLTSGYGPPPRAYNSTPPLSNYSSDHRPISAAHGQHAHQHHQNLSAQPPAQPTAQQSQTQSQQGQNSTSAMHHHHHHHHQQSPLGLAPPPHQGLAPHTHQSANQVNQQSSSSQQYREQPRYGQPAPQGLAPPPPNHYRNYSQGGDERR